MNIKNSPLFWRFEDESTDIDTSKIEALTSNEVAPIWYSYIPNADHLLEIKKTDHMTYHRIKDFYVDSDNLAEGTNKFSNECPFFQEKFVNILWGPNYGVRVNFNLFLKYWDDFLYPGDDSVIICDNENGEIFLQVCEEHIFIDKNLLFANSAKQA